MATRKKPDEAQPTPEIEQPPEQPFTPIDAPVERPAARENSNARRTSNGGNKPGGGKDSGGKKALVGGGGHSGATHRPSPKKKAKKHAVKQDIIKSISTPHRRRGESLFHESTEFQKVFSNV